MSMTDTPGLPRDIADSPGAIPSPPTGPVEPSTSEESVEWEATASSGDESLSSGLVAGDAASEEATPPVEPVTVDGPVEISADAEVNTEPMTSVENVIDEAVPTEPQVEAVDAVSPEVEEETEPEPQSESASAEHGDSAKDASEPDPIVAVPEPSKKKWYTIKVQSNREDSIKAAIERRVKIEGLEEFFGRIVIPVSREVEQRSVRGVTKRVVKKVKKFPGYLFAEVEFNDRILLLFRETSGVGDFVGGSGPGKAPLPLPEHEVARIVGDLDDEKTKKDGDIPAPIVIRYGPGDRVRIKEGSFADMEGEVKEILQPKDPKEPIRVRIEVQILGRGMPVELEHFNVEPI